VTAKLTDLASLYAGTRMGGARVPNRLVAQAMEACDGTTGGAPTERTLARYEGLARGGWGIVFVEATSVTHAAVARLQGLVLSERTAEGFRQLVARFRAANPEALLLLQITHSGPHSHPATDLTTACPNAGDGMRLLSKGEIGQVRDQFVATALLAETLGFDGIDYKLCHGYLGNDLLRPANTRNDRWGGSFENRTRFLSEGIREIQARRQSADFILGARMTFYESRRGGFGTAGPDSCARDRGEPLALIRLMGALDMNYVNLSGSGAVPQDAAELLAEEQRCAILWYERLATDLIRGEGLDLRVMGTGYSALREDAAHVAAKRLRAGHADLIGFGRQTFSDPDYPTKLQSGEDIRHCVDCGACVSLMLNHRNSGCVRRDRRCRDLYRALKRGE